MKTYREMTAEHQRRIDAFLAKYAFFAFSGDQFEEGLQKLGTTPEKLSRLSAAGGFILTDKVPAYCRLANALYDEMQRAKEDPQTGAEFCYQMFYEELLNHEFGYTADATDAIEALGLTGAEIDADPRLRFAFHRACGDILG